uniref:Uncharacterized protein n=4 Tax=Oryza TaxID=4527 RepID=A0A0D3FMC3_9ORYZ
MIMCVQPIYHGKIEPLDIRKTGRSLISIIMKKYEHTPEMESSARRRPAKLITELGAVL